MTTPKFILELREKIGHDLLWLTGITGVVLDDTGQVLLVRRADNGRWSLVAGILEPGEQPAVGLLREIEEETAVEAAIDRLVSIESLPPSGYPNGDQVQFLDLCFRCRPLRGEPRVNDDESLEVRWWPLDDLPPLAPRELTLIQHALSPDPMPIFATDRATEWATAEAPAEGRVATGR
ncbi:NUDIX hydrolase [Kribbella sp. NBC_00889]|uniref:NUDIX hydrolase n=1 Tax=Kribbella sp. NBC_00889 TaxID=2975974 RepID=UPI0038677761|nr:NUDIX domain-containing protein [Kribbella sp. NBC_00889]